MKIIKYKDHLSKAMVWFCNDYTKVNEKCDLIFLSGYYEKINKGISKQQNSLVLDLTRDEEEIFSNIKKNVKYEINRCYKENIQNIIYFSKDIKKNPKILDEFINMYNQMFKEKGMVPNLQIELINKYIEQNVFLITRAYVDDKTLSLHAYIYAKDNTRLLYSCSTFRSNDKEEQNLIARSNKYLHWEDIKYFKNKDVKLYDFGGISSIENPNGIDKFKMAFGGEFVKYYNVIYGNSIIGKIYIFLLKIGGVFK